MHSILVSCIPLKASSQFCFIFVVVVFCFLLLFFCVCGFFFNFQNVHKATKIDGKQIDEKRSIKYICFQVSLINSQQIALWYNYNLHMSTRFEKVYIKST